MNRRHISYSVKPGGALLGRLRVPGDKSISHRVVMFGALAEGRSRASGFLQSADTRATIAAFRGMGVTIDDHESGTIEIDGVGLHGLRPPSTVLDLGNSGTSARLLAGLLAGQRFDSELTGDASLSRRPMQRVVEPLQMMGARIDTAPDGTMPLRIHGGQQLKGIDYSLPVASAQIKSCLLFAGLYADGETRIHEPAPSRDHTERFLAACHWPIMRTDGTISIRGGARLRPFELEVPGDISSAAFFLVGASIAAGSDVLLESVGINPTRNAVIDILQAMGADIELLNMRELGAEPVADLRVRSARLRGIEIPEALIPIAIDEFPAIFLAAACAEGETVLRGAAELRVKESDRIQSMADGLSALGIQVQTLPDGIIVQGGSLQGGQIVSHGDHRIAMTFAMAGLVADGPVTVEDCANVATSFPGFAAAARDLGLDIQAGETLG